MFTIGIDVGGTTIRAGAIGLDGKIHGETRAATPRDGGALVDWITSAIRQIRAESAGDMLSGVGLALPGVVDAERGRLVRSVNLPFLQGRAIREEMSGSTGLPFMVMTDADAATWGEYCRRTPRPKAFVHLRLGTGVACGIVLGDRIQPTDPGRTTHWEVLVVNRGPNAAPCPCGLRGCLETIASGPAIERRASAAGCDGGLDGLQKAWRRSESAARKIVNEASRGVAAAISNLKSQISNDMVVCLGGGVLGALPCLYEGVVELAGANFVNQGSVSIHLGKLGDDAGVIGAGLLAAVVSPGGACAIRGNR